MTLGLDSFLPKPQQSPTGPDCMLLVGSSECPLQNGHIIPTMQEYMDTKTFDEFVRSRRNTEVEYIKAFQSDYLCPEFQGRGQQFHRSLLCAMLTKRTTNCISQSFTQFIPLCRDTCRQGTNALRNLFINGCVQIRTQEALLIRNETIDQYSVFCDGLPIQNPQFGACLDGSRQPIEQTQCGFPTVTEAQTFCNSINSANSCCSRVNRSIIETPLPSVQPDCQRNSKLCNTQAIGFQTSAAVLAILITVAVLFFLAVVFFAYKWLGRKKTGPMSLLDKKPFLSVISDYNGNMADELTLFVGDKLQMYETFDDGWAYGRHLGTNREGSFPLVCTVLATVE
jgi:hypothetical protein